MGLNPNPIGAGVDNPLTPTHSAIYDSYLDPLVLRDSHGSAQLLMSIKNGMLIIMANGAIGNILHGI